jgi:hypothetical protein
MDYYTPSLDEFFVGFECEYNNGSWQKVTVDPDLLSMAMDSWEHSNEEFGTEFRVRYLCREDIESLGWEYDERFDLFKKKNENKKPRTDILELEFLDKYGWKGEISIGNGKSDDDNITYFQGTIKNVNELRRIMAMIGIKA